MEGNIIFLGFRSSVDPNPDLIISNLAGGAEAVGCIGPMPTIDGTLQFVG